MSPFVVNEKAEGPVIRSTTVWYDPKVIEGTLKRIQKILESGWVILGENTREFETRFSKLHKRQYGVAVSNDTAALEIAFRLIDIRDEYVVVPANGFFSIVTAIDRAGGKVKFVDISIAENANYHPDQLYHALIDPRVKAVVLMPNGGLPVSPAALKAVFEARERRWRMDLPPLYIIGDNAQGHFAWIKHEDKVYKCGEFEDIACFSFYATKVLNTAEGGMLLMDRRDWYEEAKLYRNYGRSGEFGVSTVIRDGYNWRMTEFQAALGCEQLNVWNEILARRQLVAQWYIFRREALEEVGVELLRPVDGTGSNWYKVMTLLPYGVSKEKVKQEMLKRGVQPGADNYDVLIPHQPIFFGRFGHLRFPGAEEFQKRHLCLPISETMTEEQVEMVVNVVCEAVRVAKHAS